MSHHYVKYLSSKHEAPLGTTNINKCMPSAHTVSSQGSRWYTDHTEISPAPFYHLNLGLRKVLHLHHLMFSETWKFWRLKAFLSLSTFNTQFSVVPEMCFHCLFFNFRLICINNNIFHNQFKNCFGLVVNLLFTHTHLRFWYNWQATDSREVYLLYHQF